ncbi:TetR/AcrR family transcriptional regulator [Kribbella sp. NPDC049584]|uniref:TetR/AcrR family transcriptional regulator n=1 Tax=Kribbella sp. NPDC049584 TaxID=3154833 RepID=UPI003420BF05
MAIRETDTRQHILDAAQQVVVHSGYAATGLTEILKEAAVPKGSFYHHFSSKDAFGEALMKNYFQGYLATMDRIIADTSKSGAERTMAYWQWFYDVQTADECQGQCLVVKLAAEVSDLSEAMRLQLAEGTSQIMDRLEKLLTIALEDGSLSGDAVTTTPRELALSQYDAWLGASVMTKVQRTPDSLQRAMAGTRRLLKV